MSEIIGDTEFLRRDTVDFNIVRTLTGTGGAFSFQLEEARGLRCYLGPYARVELVGPVRCSVSAPPAADKAVVATIAIIPQSHNELPVSADQILTIAGAIQVTSSLYQSTPPVVLGFAAEAARLLKPKPVTQELPRVVGHFAAEGATQATECFLTISGSVKLEGIGFVKTW